VGEIISVKDSLHDARVLEVFSYCQYRPDGEKLRRLAEQYAGDGDVSAFGFADGGELIGVVALKRLGAGSFEILGIAVDPRRRGQGIGRRMLEEAALRLECGALYAETDGDAVGFYQKCGFDVVSLGMKYPGVVRYRCEKRLQRSAPAGRGA